MLTRSDLSALLAADPPLGVSIFLPTHVLGSETRQDPIRLKNLVSRARTELTSIALTSTEADDFLAPAVALTDDHDFCVSVSPPRPRVAWFRQSNGRDKASTRPDNRPVRYRASLTPRPTRPAPLSPAALLAQRLAAQEVPMSNRPGSGATRVSRRLRRAVVTSSRRLLQVLYTGVALVGALVAPPVTTLALGFAFGGPAPSFSR